MHIVYNMQETLRVKIMKQLNQENNDSEIAVIGAGIVGICCALNLQKQGYRVCLIDRKGVAQGCSKGNAGHFATEQVFPLAEFGLLAQLPAMLFKKAGAVSIRPTYLPKILPWFVRFLLNMRTRRFKQNTDALKSLNSLSINAYEVLLSEMGLSHFLLKSGSLLTFESTPLKKVDQLRQLYAEQGIGVRLVMKSDLKALEPGLADDVKYALLFTDVAHTFDPEQLAIALFDCFISRGGRFLKDEIISVKQSQHSTQVYTATGKNDFSKTVIAAGAWSKRLIKGLGYQLPLDTERGYHVMLQNPAQLSRPVASYERKMIMTPMSKGVRVAGTVEFAGLDAPLTKSRGPMLENHARQLLQPTAQNTTTKSEVWMGMRPSLPDSLPVIGAAPEHNAIFFAFGHQHLGLTQAAITGNIIASLVNGEEPAIDISPFCISRFN